MTHAACSPARGQRRPSLQAFLRSPRRKAPGPQGPGRARPQGPGRARSCARALASVAVSAASVAARWSARSRPHNLTSFFVSARMRCASCAARPRRLSASAAPLGSGGARRIMQALRVAAAGRVACLHATKLCSPRARFRVLCRVRAGTPDPPPLRHPACLPAARSAAAGGRRSPLGQGRARAGARSRCARPRPRAARRRPPSASRRRTARP